MLFCPDLSALSEKRCNNGFARFARFDFVGFARKDRFVRRGAKAEKRKKNEKIYIKKYIKKYWFAGKTCNGI
jgi:hypothetical protein